MIQRGKSDQSLFGPSRQLVAWVAAVLGAGVTPKAARSLHGGESPWWIDLETPGGQAVAVVLRSPSSRISAQAVATNAAALEIAARYGIPVPRLLAADLDGDEAGVPATLESAVREAAGWPVPVTADLLRAAGAAIALVHTIPLEPRPDLPFRSRPIAVDDFATDRRLGRIPTTELLSGADERLRSLPIPSGPTVFVHGDVWPGNVLVAGDVVDALIDWKTAGAGRPGIDLGELRKQVSIRYDDEAPRYVLEGWERAAGTRARDVAYWDAIAALNTHTDADGPVVAAARDAFLRDALHRL